MLKWSIMGVAAGLAVTLTSAPVQAQSSLTNWNTLLEGLRAEGEKADAQLPPDLTPQEQAEVAVMKLGALTAGYLNIVHGDPDHPMFRPSLSLYGNYLAPNADTHYYQARVDGSGVYRLRGEAGNIPIVNITPRRAYSEGATYDAKGFADLDIVKLRKGPNGAVDVILSAKRPDGYAGDWLYLDPRADVLAMRLVSDDWGRQKDPRLSIERLDKPSRGARPTEAEINRNLAMLPGLVNTWTSSYAQYATKLASDAGGVNKIKEDKRTNIGLLAGQRYFEMAWDFAPDEALILEATVPKCRYWSVLLADRLYATLDWVSNQSSLNRNQARIDADGKVRMVIAHSDPGVPNWLDTVDHPKGAMQWRWMDCDGPTSPTVTRVKLSELRRHLPVDTPTVTAEQRDQALRERRMAAQLRREW